jgi:hypothetical protein
VDVRRDTVCQKGTAVGKTYQKKTAAPSSEEMTSPLEAATVALTELAESARKGMLALAVATARR